MIPIKLDLVEDHISNYKHEINVQKNKLRSDLLRMLFNSITTETWMVQYINKLIDYSDEIITCKPTELQILKGEFDRIIARDKIKKKKFKQFRDELISKMGYKDRRSDFYPSYFRGIGIKSCVYCNSQLTISAETVKEAKTKFINSIEAKFQVDHHIPKSEYPCFSISLYNLYPVCASCNNIKRDCEVHFKLYEVDPNLCLISQYKFKLVPGSITKYLLNKKCDDIKIRFYDPDKPDKNKISKGSFQDTFDIEGIYNTQKDIAEELIIKAQIYNEEYKKKLIVSFPKLFSHNNLANRVLIGNYTEANEIHKRPMAKFTQDIARQLKLI